jgi:NAD(P)-dependent dehydrogenase (short-subunit alcohol dehydrogenase family)
MIANAGIPSKAGGLDDKLENWRKVVDVDFSGAYYCARAAGEIFRKQGSGNLIFTASMSGHAANIPQQQVRMRYLSEAASAKSLCRLAIMHAKQESSTLLNPWPLSGLTLPESTV